MCYNFSAFGNKYVIKLRGTMSERLYYRKKTNKWEARYVKGKTADGKTRYGSVFADTREEAIQRRAELVGLNPDEPANRSELNILILGAGSYGQEAKEALEKIRIFHKISFLDDYEKGDEIIGKCGDTGTLKAGYGCAFVAIADNEIRRKYSNILMNEGFYIPAIVSPDAIVSPKAKIGMGTMVFSQANVSAGAVIGDFAIVQSNALVNADAEIGDYCRLDSGAIVLKGGKVPEGEWIKPGEIFGEVS